MKRANKNINNLIVNYMHHPVRNTLFILFTILLYLFLIGAFSYKAFAILSESMEPTINTGDIIIYKDYNMNKDIITTGDIIVFELKDGKKIIHRVISANDNKYITKGDNNKEDDKVVIHDDNVFGVYKFRIRYLGYPTYFFNKIFGR